MAGAGAPRLITGGLLDADAARAGSALPVGEVEGTALEQVGRARVLLNGQVLGDADRLGHGRRLGPGGSQGAGGGHGRSSSPLHGGGGGEV